MSSAPDSSLRRAVLLLAAGVSLGILPLNLGLGLLGIPAAMAGEEDDSADDAEDNADDSADDAEDNADDRADDADDNADDDAAEDNSGSGGGDEDGPDGDGDRGASDNSGGSSDDGSRAEGSETRLRNITVHYSDGWIEAIIDGQYQLIDNQSRQVILRRATVEDFDRMAALVS